MGENKKDKKKKIMNRQTNQKGKDDEPKSMVVNVNVDRPENRAGAAVKGQRRSTASRDRETTSRKPKTKDKTKKTQDKPTTNDLMTMRRMTVPQMTTETQDLDDDDEKTTVEIEDRKIRRGKSSPNDERMTHFKPPFVLTTPEPEAVTSKGDKKKKRQRSGGGGKMKKGDSSEEGKSSEEISKDKTTKRHKTKTTKRHKTKTTQRHTTKTTKRQMTTRQKTTRRKTTTAPTTTTKKKPKPLPEIKDRSLKSKAEKPAAKDNRGGGGLNPVFKRSMPLQRSIDHLSDRAISDRKKKNEAKQNKSPARRPSGLPPQLQPLPKNRNLSNRGGSGKRPHQPLKNRRQKTVERKQPPQTKGSSPWQSARRHRHCTCR